ncbi:hypothetical protein E2C01_004659 [Portunus trituberculatus]|uniref:Uncharacterized protein n=1 Tax=Portunus trituberculatus TaxID=210409 RepID=A0A5B7CQK0_PORTR|nr:hypothetical protein [Portunus trituberculatus]
MYKALLIPRLSHTSLLSIVWRGQIESRLEQPHYVKHSACKFSLSNPRDGINVDESTSSSSSNIGTPAKDTAMVVQSFVLPVLLVAEIVQQASRPPEGQIGLPHYHFHETLAGKRKLNRDIREGICYYGYVEF